MWKVVQYGILGTSALLTLYFVVLTLVSGWSYTKIQFAQNWYWILGLAVGFGIQVSLFSFARTRHRAAMSGKVLGATGTTSGAAMLACCTHYLVNILPFIGVSGFAIFVGKYQTWLFAVGLAFNLAGIAYLTNKIQLSYAYQN